MTELPYHCDTDGTYRNIGGWLILFAIGIVLYPAQILVALFTELLPAFSQANGSVPTMAGSQGYQPLWTTLLIVELVGNICFFIFSICLVVVFFQRRQTVIGLAVVFLLANLVFVGLDFFVIHFYLDQAGSISPNSALNLVRTGVASAIWIPYFFLSKRVKRTFVN
jgi:hypothetical protein